jgi:hypothetical protein
VDFNMMDSRGRVLALVNGERRPHLKVGDVVTLVDEEGNRSDGTVEKLRRAAVGPETVAHVVLEATSDRRTAAGRTTPA